MPNFIEALMQLLGGGDAPQQQLPQEAPVPMPRPGTLPNGTFTPQRESEGPLAQLFGGDLSHMLRASGAGMANLRSTGGDPYLAFAQGFGGATGYGAEQEAAAAKAAMEAENLAYERSTGEAKTQRDIERDAAELELRRIAEARQAKTADLANQKTLLEIRREARSNGITVSQQLEIERIAQAAGEMLTGERRKEAIDAERERLVDQITSGQGITGKAGGLTGGSEITATGPNGEKVVLKNGEWVPLE